MKVAPLSPEARRLLELGTQVEPPTPEQSERMDRALAPLFRAGRVGAGSAASQLGMEGRGTAHRAPSSSADAPELGASERSAIHRRPSPPSTLRRFEPVRRFDASPRLDIWRRLDFLLRLRCLLRARGRKPWLALGALAATASAAFWLGRVSSVPSGVVSASSAALSVPSPAVSIPDSALSLPTDDVTATAAAALSPSDAVGSARASAPPVSSEAPPPPGLAPGADPDPTPPATTATAVAPPAASARVASPRPASVQAPRDARAPRAPATGRGRDSLGLGAEIEQLARVEAALRQGRAAQALTLLDQRTVSHLLEQAAALRAIALCELGDTGAARRSRDVLERWPVSAFQPRIASACGL